MARKKKTENNRSPRSPSSRPSSSSRLVLVGKGEAGWSTNFSLQFGRERWKTLLSALGRKPRRYAAFVSSSPPAAFPEAFFGEKKTSSLLGGNQSTLFTPELRAKLVSFLHLSSSHLPSPNLFLVSSSERNQLIDKNAGVEDEEEQEEEEETDSFPRRGTGHRGDSTDSTRKRKEVHSCLSSSSSPPPCCAPGEEEEEALSQQRPSTPSPHSVTPSSSSSPLPSSSSPYLAKREEEVSRLPCESAKCLLVGDSERQKTKEEEKEETALRQLEREKVYYLDAASAFAASYLSASPGDKVLDLCAAPGGKSLILASMIFGRQSSSFSSLGSAGSSPSNGVYRRDEGGEGRIREKEEKKKEGLLVCNEVSKARLERLRAVMVQFLPNARELQEKGFLQFTSCCGMSGKGRGGGTSYERLAPYDKILVDAPCSSDRHLLKAFQLLQQKNQKKNDGGGRKGGAATNSLSSWSTAVPKAHAERQLELLKNSFRLLRVGGFLLYSTCALSYLENDQVIKKLLKYYGEDTIEICRVGTSGRKEKEEESEARKNAVFRHESSAREGERRESSSSSSSSDFFSSSSFVRVISPYHQEENKAPEEEDEKTEKRQVETQEQEDEAFDSSRLSSLPCSSACQQERKEEKKDEMEKKKKKRSGEDSALLSGKRSLHEGRDVTGEEEEEEKEEEEAREEAEEVDPSFLWVLEETRYGYFLLPDRLAGSGPIYFCKMRLKKTLLSTRAVFHSGGGRGPEGERRRVTRRP